MNLLLDLPFAPTIVPQDTATSNIMSWSAVESNLSDIVSQLKEYEFDKIICLGESGMIPARLLADRLGIKKIIPFTNTEIPKGTIIVDIMSAEAIISTRR